MNIKSNKDGFKWFKPIMRAIKKDRTIWYYFPTVLMLILYGFIYMNGATWGIYLALAIIALSVHVVITFVGEQDYWNSYYERTPDFFALFYMPIIIIWLSYPLAIRPMIHDYNHSSRIDKVIAKDVNGTVMWNDNNYLFMFENKPKHILVHSFSGSSDAYYKLKSKYLDGKVKMIKKEVKSWYDDKPTVKYSLDGYTFD